MKVKRAASAASVILVSLALAGFVAWAGGQEAVRILGLPVIAWCAAFAFSVQWVAFVPAYARQTERFYDLTGSLTYIGVTWFAVLASPPIDLRAIAIAALVTVWASRLGIFLFRRIRASGSDSRFDEIKPSAARFLVAWTLQGLWVFLTLCAALAAITSRDPATLGLQDALGLAVWLGGFTIEAVADRQKSAFREEHPERFVDCGLWAWSRHPNYFGEIVLWTGIAIMASSTLRGWQWVTLISPFFVAFLLLQVSGIPMAERRAEERWGDDADYQRYKAQTPVLIPKPPR